MREIKQAVTAKSAAAESLPNPRTTFLTVPIAEVPLPVDSAKGSVHRPIILVVDDEPIVADTLADILIRSGYTAMTAYDGESALETAALIPPDLLIANDVSLPVSSVDLAIAVKSESPECKIILLSGKQSAAKLKWAQSGDTHLSLLSKPVHPADLLSKVTSALNASTKLDS